MHNLSLCGLGVVVTMHEGTLALGRSIVVECSTRYSHPFDTSW